MVDSLAIFALDTSMVTVNMHTGKVIYSRHSANDRIYGATTIGKRVVFYNGTHKLMSAILNSDGSLSVLSDNVDAAMPSCMSALVIGKDTMVAVGGYQGVGFARLTATGLGIVLGLSIPDSASVGLLPASRYSIQTASNNDLVISMAPGYQRYHINVDVVTVKPISVVARARDTKRGNSVLLSGARSYVLARSGLQIYGVQKKLIIR